MEGRGDDPCHPPFLTSKQPPEPGFEGVQGGRGGDADGHAVDGLEDGVEGRLRAGRAGRRRAGGDEPPRLRAGRGGARPGPGDPRRPRPPGPGPGDGLAARTRRGGGGGGGAHVCAGRGERQGPKKGSRACGASAGEGENRAAPFFVSASLLSFGARVRVCHTCLLPRTRCRRERGAPSHAPAPAPQVPHARTRNPRRNRA